MFVIDYKYFQMMPSHVQIHPHMGKDLDKFDLSFHLHSCYFFGIEC